jgi:hypothetical protein
VLGQNDFNFRQTNIVGSSLNSHNALAVVDMNGDLRDDVVTFSGNQKLLLLTQGNRNENFELTVIDEGLGSSQWSIVAVDLDRNGQRDIVLASAHDSLRIYYQIGVNWVKRAIYTEEVFAQGMNAVDIDNDGWLDVFLCNDVGYNVLYRNVNGDLIPDNKLFRELEADSSSGNYGSIWSDFDLDGDQDLYLSKCSAFAEKGDIRRINMLYRNDIDSLKDIAKSLMVSNGAQSWTADFLDYDNDGDFDLWVTNHGVPSVLYENINGRFLNVTNSRDISYICSVNQSLHGDYDFNGYDDIISVGGPQFLHFGNVKSEFDLSRTTFDIYRVLSLAQGDLNHDGKTDLYTSYETGVSDRVWMNEFEVGNHLDVYLFGSSSNLDGVGVKIISYTKNWTNIDEVRAGESYGVMNSLTKRIGYGQIERIDSLVVLWPSGKKQVLVGIPTSGYIHCVEGSWAIHDDYLSNYFTRICSSDSLHLGAPDGFQYKWSNGDTTREIVVKEPGFFQVYIAGGSGSFYPLPGTEVELNPRTNYEVLLAEGMVTNCHNKVVHLQANSEAKNIIWSNGSMKSNIEVMEPGPWYYSYDGSCMREFSDTIEIKFVIESDTIEVRGDTIKKNGRACLRSNSTQTIWYNAHDMELQRGDSFCLSAISNDTCVYAAGFNTHTFDTIVLGKTLGKDSLYYQGPNKNEKIFFQVKNDAILYSVEVMAERAGIREFAILNPSRNAIWRKQINLREGRNEIVVELLLPENTRLYQLICSDSINIKSFGSRSPYLASSAENLNYPYQGEDLVDIIYTSSTTKRYDYFFSWKISKLPLVCIGEKKKVCAVVDTTLSTINSSHELFAYPNPVADELSIFINEKIDELQLYDVQGHTRVIRDWSYNEKVLRINCENLPIGLFILELKNEDSRFLIRFMKQ